MIIKSQGYRLDFVQKQNSKDDSDHKFTLIYKFKSLQNNWKYIVRAEYHLGDIFAVKFYAQQQRKSDYKYSKITNKGDIYNILVTIARLIPELLPKYPNASFGFTGARSVDLKVRRVENHINNQRFRVYKEIVSNLIGSETFSHFEYEKISGYLLINNNTDTQLKEREIIEMFSRNYNDLPDIS